MELQFGDYVTIEQNRYGADNEMYLYKVISTCQSNCWVDVPVVSIGKEEIHSGKIANVVRCICCGIDETDVQTFRAEDVVLSQKHGIREQIERLELDLHLEKQRADELSRKLGNG